MHKYEFTTKNLWTSSPIVCISYLYYVLIFYYCYNSLEVKGEPWDKWDKPCVKIH